MKRRVGRRPKRDSGIPASSPPVSAPSGARLAASKLLGLEIRLGQIWRVKTQLYVIIKFSSSSSNKNNSSYNSSSIRNDTGK